MTRGKRLCAVVLTLGLSWAAAGVPSGAGPGPKAGRTVAHRAGGKVVKSTPGKVPAAINLPSADHAAEPTVGILSDGTLFYVAADLDGQTLPNQVIVRRSTDKGVSWEDTSPSLGPQRLHAVTLDPYIWVDEWTDRLYTIDLTVACSYLSYSDDAGASWTTNPLACGIPVNDHQSLFGGPPATSSPPLYPNVLYYCFNNVATSSCSKSIDGGLTFVATGEPAFKPGDGDEGSISACGGIHGHGVVGHDGTVYLPRNFCRGPYLAISKDEGRTWDQVRVAGLEVGGGLDPSVAVDSKGNLYYVFVGPKRLPYLVYSRNGGTSWSRPLQIAAPGVKEVNLATLDAVAPGKVAVAYYGSTNVAIKRQGDQEQRDHTKASWNAYVSMTVDLFSKDPLFYSATINDPGDPVKRQTCGPGRCGRVFDFIDIEIGYDGTPYAAFVDACTGDCGKRKGITSLGDAGFVGRLVGGPSLR